MPGEDHRQAVLVGGLDGLLVAHRAAGLDHRGRPGRRDLVDAVAEGEEGVGADDGPLERQHGLQRGDPAGVDAAHLAGADAGELVVGGEDDGVGLDVAHHPPGEIEGAVLRGGRLALRDDRELAHVADLRRVRVLDQVAARDALEVVPAGRRGRAWRMRRSFFARRISRALGA